MEANEFKYSLLNQSCKDLEMQWMALEIKNMRKLVIVNIYRPPQGDYNKACQMIHSAIANANVKDNSEIFVLGDFNIDLLDKKSPLTKELETTLTLWNLKAQLTCITRPNLAQNSQSKGTCIDNIFTNSEHIALAVTLDWNFSDHLAVAIKRKRVKVVHEKVEFQGRSYKNYDAHDLRRHLLQLDWNIFYNSQNPGECWDYLEKEIRVYLDEICPLKSFKVKEVREPWVTNELLEEIKDKDRSLKTAKRSGKSEDWKKDRIDRNQVGRLVELARANFLTDQQYQLADDPKKFWRVVKTVVPGKKSTSGRISLVNNERVDNPQNIEQNDTANFINDFFCNIGPNLASKHNEPWEFHDEVMADECAQFEADFVSISKLVIEISTIKSSGFLNISSKVFKDAFTVLVPHLVYMFNLSFVTGIFPDRWKKATIIPLYKGGDKTNVSNNRPVSLLPLPGKLIKKIAHARITSFLDHNEIISEQQGGFRKGFSTASSIADLTNSLFNNVNNDLTSLLAFIDLKKALDTVNHDILLEKLDRTGMV